MMIIKKSLKNMLVSTISLYLLPTLVLGGTYLLYETKPLPTTYQYENALQEAAKAPHIAKLTISPTISYSCTGDNSLRKITHTIQLLSESKTNKGLVINLLPLDKAIDDETLKEILLSVFVHYTILKDALEAYKEKTKRKIIVHVTNRLHGCCLFILAIADQVILDTTTILKHTEEETLQWIASCKENNNSFIERLKEIHKASKAQEKNTDCSEMLERLQSHCQRTLHAGDYKVRIDPKEEEKLLNEYCSAIRDAITTLAQKRGQFPPLPNLKDIEQEQSKSNDKKESNKAVLAVWEQWKQSLCTYLADYGSGKRPEEVEAYIKVQIEQVPIIDLNPCINDKHTLEYTPQNRNAHRRTEACFETIIISGKIDSTLVKKIRPLIQSVHCDPNIKGVIIIWDSPGGEDLPAKALLRLLKKLDAAKPIIHVAALCTSAAYLLAAGTGVKLTAYRKALLGSIGVRVDVDIMFFYRYDAVKVKKYIEKIRQWMIQVIAQNRAKILGVNQKAYRQKLNDTEARTYIATRAEEEQLIDEIGTLKSAIDALKSYTGLDLPVYYSEDETQPINA